VRRRGVTPRETFSLLGKTQSLADMEQGPHIGRRSSHFLCLCRHVRLPEVSMRALGIYQSVSHDKVAKIADRFYIREYSLGQERCLNHLSSAIMQTDSAIHLITEPSRVLEEIAYHPVVVRKPVLRDFLVPFRVEVETCIRLAYSTSARGMYLLGRKFAREWRSATRGVRPLEGTFTGAGSWPHPNMQFASTFLIRFLWGSRLLGRSACASRRVKKEQGLLERDIG